MCVALARPAIAERMAGTVAVVSRCGGRREPAVGEGEEGEKEDMKGDDPPPSASTADALPGRTAAT